jgi:H/ACA ribonucleoprotein complex subunit 4
MGILEKINFGIINIDKPAGPTSFTITDSVRRSLGINKATHLGTLDPAVTGVLPIALGKAARLSGYLMGAEKEYVGKMHIHDEVDIKIVKDAIKNKFLGKIMQLPPVRSRVKREEREREIFEFEILKKEGKDIEFRVKCQAGTYIRKLIHDLGQELKVGAHMAELRRIRAGLFEEKTLVPMEKFLKAVEEFKKGKSELLDKIIVEPESIIEKRFPVITLKPDNEAIKKIKNGSPIYKKFVEKTDDFHENAIVAVMLKGKLVEMAEALLSSKNFESMENDEIVAKPKTVLI